jgi:TfoX/Sxy family transcriptional regulator of competence genes
MKRSSMRPTTKPKKTAGKAPDLDDPRFLPVIEAFAGDRQVTRGRMFGSVGLKVNGKVFAMLVKGSFVAKLPKDRVNQLVTSRTGEYFDPGHGKLMKEWVALAGAVNQWVDLAREARRFVGGGKP